MEEQKMETTEVKTFTQDEVNAIVSDRLKRANEKYADYDALKEKASKLDEIEEAQKSELQKANEKAQALETELEQMNNSLYKSKSDTLQLASLTDALYYNKVYSGICKATGLSASQGRGRGSPSWKAFNP